MMPKTAKQSGGTEVSTPATLPLMCSPSRTSSSSAPRLVMAGRRLSAVRTRPTATRRSTQGAGPVGPEVVCAVCGAGESVAEAVAVPVCGLWVRVEVRVWGWVSSSGMRSIIESWDD